MKPGRRQSPLIRGTGANRNMALTRKLLLSMGIEGDKIDQIIEAHSETVEALKDERDSYREAAEALPGVQKELDELKAKPDDGYKEKWEKEHAEFEAFKEKVSKADSEREKSTLYRKLLADAGVDPKRLDAVMRVADLSEVAVEDGKLKDAEALAESVKKEWSDFIVSTGTKGSEVDNPPAGGDPGSKEPHSIAEAMRQRMEASASHND